VRWLATLTPGVPGINDLMMTATAVYLNTLWLFLLGIAGRDAFLRAPNGQTGLLKEGEELGGVKLLRIAHNRVLIEHDGQKKELTMFSGFGSETLIPKEKEKLQ
jgi:hypothetical protein